MTTNFASNYSSGNQASEAPLPHSLPPAINKITGQSIGRALFAISSLGLGHATRTLVVIREYLRQGYAITVVSTGNALAFLRLELQDEPQVDFRDEPDYPPLERGTGWRLYWYLFIDLLTTLRIMRHEHRKLQTIAADYDFIFSDGRYGFHSQWAPSFILSHQISFVPPKWVREASWITEKTNIAALKKFDMLFIPDYFGPSMNLAGNLSHSRTLYRCPHRYIGILSSYQHIEQVQDIDYLFVISGYLLEHKGSFVHDLLEQAVKLAGKKVFVLGNTNGNEAEYTRYRSNMLEIYSVATGEIRQELFSRARMIISRSGYSTLMDLVEHDKRALLIPTPNQSEQEYLATYLSDQSYYVTKTQQENFDLEKTLQAGEKTRLFEPPWKTEASLRRITDCINEMTRQHFISIIVPAYNEETGLEETLQCLLSQRYPSDHYEIVVVENGSTDATLEIARRITQHHDKDRLRLITLDEGGVSHAKNVGLDKLAPQSEWVVFCDADTHLSRNFLPQLNTWLNRHGEDNLSVGTTSVLPEAGCGWYGRCWFHIYDIIHRITQTSFSIQVARTSVARGIRFREDLNFAEDINFIHECRRYGRFFFVPTNQVSTSTRRFDSVGYLRQGLRWTYEALMPMRFKINRKYDVIR